MKWKRLEGVDVLRGLAIFFVLMNHINLRLRFAKVPYTNGIPQAVVMALEAYGLAAHTVTPVPPAPAPPPLDRRSLKLFVGTAIANLRFALTKQPPPPPGWGFQILGIKTQ